jgi:dephospho-CoA kinase
MKVIGLTGNSGSGKSLVSSILCEKGAYIIDADKISHEVLYPTGKAYNEVINLFTTNILDENGFINRVKLGEIVFSDKTKLNKLVKVTHKYIIENIVNDINRVKNNNFEYRFIVIDAALLIESGLHNISNDVWLVYADENLRLERIKKRDSIKYESILNRFNSQNSFDYLKEFADVIVNNLGTIDELRELIDELLR